MKPNLYLYLLLFFSCSFYSQQSGSPDTAQLFYRHFTVQDGLPSNEAYYGYQDKAGYIWVCGDNGVSRFDGVRFKNYNNADGLRSNVIYGCKEDNKGSLWLYSFSGELYRYQPVTDRFESPRFNDSLARLLAGRVILDLVFERDTLYVMTLSAYVKVVFGAKGQEQLSLVEAGPQTLSVRLLGNGEVVVINASEENITRFDLAISGPGKFSADTVRNIPINGLVQQNISALRQGDELNIVFGENLLNYNIATQHYTIQQLPFTHIAGLKKSSLGILCGSYGKGLWSFDGKNNHVVFKQWIKNKNIASCFEDKQGGIWGFSQTDGVYFIPTRTALSFARNENEASRRVTSMFTKGDSAFYMTYSGALFLVTAKGLPMQKQLIEPGQYNMREMKALNANEILLYAGRNMRYEIGSGKVSGISPMEICERSASGYQPTVFARHNRLWIKTCGGISLNEKIIFEEWKYGAVFSQAVSGETKMWLGTTNDLIYADTQRGVFTSVGKKYGFAKFSVRQILALGADSVLVASNQGVFLIVKDQIKKSITAQNGLSSNKVLTLFLNKEELWAGTSLGIDLIQHFRDGRDVRVTSVTGLTGISNCPVTQVGCIGNYVIAGTDEGVYLFDKKQIFGKPIMVAPLLAGITVNDTLRIHESGDLDLDYSQNSLVINFAALNYRNSLYNKYRYRLYSGEGTAWVLTSENSVSFPQLSPGTYAFELQAMNPDGSWSQSTNSFKITIQKPFWQTWWFLSLLVIWAGFVAYFILLFRVKQMQKMGDLTGKLSEAKMQALGMQLNPHFVFNALNSVSFHIANSDSKATLKILEKFSKLMRMVFRNSQHAIIPLEDELKALNLYIELETIRLGKEFSFKMDIESINVSECKIPALLLQPFVENAIWHGISPLKTPGKLELIFMRIGDTLQIEIIDNGIGRLRARELKPASKKRLHSLDIIKERLALLRTKYHAYTHVEISNAFEDEENCGTKVLLIIPWLSDSEIHRRSGVLKQFMLDDQSAYN